MNKTILAVVLIALVGLGLFFMLGQSHGSSPSTGNLTISDSTPSTSTQVTSVQPDNTAPQEFSLDADIGKFTPSELTVKKGIPVIIHITAKSIDPNFQVHGFAIPEFGVSVQIPIGTTQTVTFTPDKTGDFRFFCNVICGQGHKGQSGILHVID